MSMCFLSCIWGLVILEGVGMILYKTEMVKRRVFDKLICDRCKQEVIGDMELQETHSIRFTGGYSSVFGDGSDVSCDLCQQCIKKLIGDFCIYNKENIL